MPDSTRQLVMAPARLASLEPLLAPPTQALMVLIWPIRPIHALIAILVRKLSTKTALCSPSVDRSRNAGLNKTTGAYDGATGGLSSGTTTGAGVGTHAGHHQHGHGHHDHHVGPTGTTSATSGVPATGTSTTTTGSTTAGPHNSNLAVG